VKFEDVDYRIPSMRLLLKIGQLENMFILEDFEAMEEHLLDFYEWKISHPTPIHFIDFYLHVSALGETTTALITRHSSSLPTNCWDCLYKVCNYSHTSRDNFYLTLVSITDTNFILFKPSLVAAAAVMVARAILGIHPHWTDHMTAITGYCFEELQVVAIIMMQLFYN